MGERTAYRGASQAAITTHYDTSEEFFALWLDPTMTYTCARWHDGDTLERAQLRKLDLHADALRLPQGARVLDVGCGWGSMLARLTTGYGVGRAVGLTLSALQAARAASLGEQIEARTENWVDHVAADGYDAIVSLGAFEHFARWGLPREQRVAAYRDFFEACRGWLRPGSRMALQTNVKGNNTRMDRTTVRDLMFVLERIFPESEIPALDEVIAAAARLFDVVSVRNDPDDYARTCRVWHDGLVARRAEAVELVGAQATADYERYLAACVGHFQRRHLGLARIVLEAV